MSKRTDWEVGAWYINPMLARSSSHALYVRINSFDIHKFQDCTSFHFDQFIREDGQECALQVTQSNSAYEKDMVKVDIEVVRAQLKQKRKRTQYGL